jgi:hypothetical protein
MIPTIIDSHGNPGIFGAMLDVELAMVDVSELKVDEVELMKLDVVTVDTIKDVKVVVAVNMLPSWTNLSIVDSSWDGTSDGSGGAPTIQPLLGDNMKTESRVGGITWSPSKDGASVTCAQTVPSQ